LKQTPKKTKKTCISTTHSEVPRRKGRGARRPEKVQEEFREDE